MGRAARRLHPSALTLTERWSPPMRKTKQRKPNDLSRSLTALDMDHTLIAVIEMSLSSWLVAGIVPGVERQPLKKLKIDECAFLEASGWRVGSGRTTSKPMSSMHRASPSHANTVVPKRIGSIPSS